MRKAARETQLKVTEPFETPCIFLRFDLHVSARDVSLICKKLVQWSTGANNVILMYIKISSNDSTFTSFFFLNLSTMFRERLTPFIIRWKNIELKWKKNCWKIFHLQNFFSWKNCNFIHLSSLILPLIGELWERESKSTYWGGTKKWLLHLQVLDRKSRTLRDSHRIVTNRELSEICLKWNV